MVPAKTMPFKFQKPYVLINWQKFVLKQQKTISMKKTRQFTKSRLSQPIQAPAAPSARTQARKAATDARPASTSGIASQ